MRVQSLNLKKKKRDKVNDNLKYKKIIKKKNNKKNYKISKT
jgi:hypothetical protein